MDEEIETLIVRVRADTQGFARDVAEMRGQIEGPLAAGADRAGRAIETALVRAARTGSLGFEDLRRVAMSVMSEIAGAAIRSGIGAIGGAGGRQQQGLGQLIGPILGALGLPGRATGGPVSPGRGYVVGERGPELFVPTSSGQVVASGGGGEREVRVAIRVDARGAGADAPRALAQSSRQVARAVRASLRG